MRKILTRIWIIIIAVFLVYYNIKANSVYYAKNMPRGAGQHPELVMAIINLKYLYISDTNDLSFDFDGNVSITNRQNLIISTSGDTEFIFADNGISYLLNKNLNIIDATEMSILRSYKVDFNEEKTVMFNIRKLLQPIIDNQKKPLINLQWLFNLIYQDQFK